MADPRSVRLALSIMLAMIALVVALLAGGRLATQLFALAVWLAAIITYPSPP